MYGTMKGIVESTKVGYCGGETENPTYTSVCSGDGHTEAIKLDFVKNETNFEKILHVFFNEHSPQWKAKAQYKSAIWCQNEAQYAVAIRMIENLERDGKGPIKTDVYSPSESSVTSWYDAEDYHQDFYRKQSARSWI